MNASQTESATPASAIASDASPGYHEPFEQQAAHIVAQFSSGNLTGLRQVLACAREARDWQDRIHMLDLVAAAIPLDVLETACAIEPDAADLAVVRCAYYSAHTLQQRRGLAEVSPDCVRRAGDSIRAAMTSLETAASLDPADPTAFACIMGALGIFDQLKPVMKHAFHRATEIAPELTAFLAARQLPPVSPSPAN